MNRSKPSIHRARSILEAAGRRWPDIWRDVDAIRLTRRAEWPEHVYLPLDQAAVTLLRYLDARGLQRPRNGAEMVRPGSELAGLSAWRTTQGVYRFDPDLYAPLIETPITAIPGELLRRLPGRAVYVETPGMTAPLLHGGQTPLYGAFAWLDWRRDLREDILTLALDTGEGLAIGHIPLIGTLDEALARVESDWREGVIAGTAEGHPPAGYAAAASRVFSPILSLLLYLCSEQPDMPAHPPRPLPKRTKGGWRMFPADRTTVWDVGVRIGAALRKANFAAESIHGEIDPEAGRARPRAHVRRAHWHTYLIGAGRSERRLKWLPPIPVNVETTDELPTTIRRIE